MALPFQVPGDLKTLSSDDLTALRAQVRTAATQFADMELSDVTEETNADLDTSIALLEGIDAERDRRRVSGGKFAALQARLGDSDDEADEDAATEDAEVDEAVPAAKPKAAPKAREVVAASGTKPTDVVPVEEATARFNGTPAVILAGANVPGHSAGMQMDWLDVANVALKRFGQYSAQGSAPGPRLVNELATIKLDYPAELTASVGDGEDISALLAYAGDEKRLPGGSLLKSIQIRNQAAGNSLTAAGQGWCAPSEVLYDLCELESGEGMLDIPEINVSRGGIKFTTGPDFSTIYGGAGYFHYTEAQVITGVTKPCMPVPCPTFTEIRLDADGLCISTDLLQLRGYPELIARFMRGAMIAHAHKINTFMINQLVTGSTALVLPSGTASHTPPLTTSVWGTDHSVVTSLLSSIDLAIVDYKYRQRMALGATLEVVLPFWVQSWIRADISRKAFYDGGDSVDQFAVTMAKINEWMTARNARVQWVYDWQDALYWAAYPTGAPSAWQQFGATTAGTDYVQDWPHTVQVLVYAAGTWVRGNADIITLDTVYDSTLLSANRVTQLFTEQGILAAKTCFDSRVYTITGATGGLVPSGAGNYAPTAQPAWTNP